jgi:hypothetical protein
MAGERAGCQEKSGDSQAGDYQPEKEIPQGSMCGILRDEYGLSCSLHGDDD